MKDWKGFLKKHFKNPDPMPLLPERMSVLKSWETSMG